MEEIGLACSLAGFVVIAPADEVSTKALVRAAAAYDGPVFIRTGRPKAPVIYAADRKFEIGKSVEVAAGKDITLIANGLLVAQALLAADVLEAEGVSARVIDMHTAKPLDRDAIARAAAETGAIVVAEEHLVDGGLGVRVAQAVAETHPCVMEFVGIHDRYAESGNPDETAGQIRPGSARYRGGRAEGAGAQALAGPMEDAGSLAGAYSFSRARPASGLSRRTAYSHGYTATRTLCSAGPPRSFWDGCRPTCWVPMRPPSGEGVLRAR